MPVKFDRIFHLGSYEGGHAQVLFRSGRTGYHQGEFLSYGSVADVLFKNVAAMAITESYYRLEVSLASDAEIGEFVRFLRCEMGDRRLYALRGEGAVGFVLAGAMYWIDDNEGSVDEPSVLLGRSDRAKEIQIWHA